MNARMERICLRGTLLAALIASACSGEPSDGGGDGECTISGAQGEEQPGFPFDLTKFENEVVPLLKSDCSACHNVGGANHANFAIFTGNPVKGSCDFVNTFESVRDVSDTTTPADSRLVKAFEISGHPTFEQAKVDILLDFVRDANITCVDGGGCAPSGAISFFDRTVFDTDIQPALDSAGCAVQGCHLAPNGVFGFSLNPAPAPNSAELKANFDLVTQMFADLTTPAASKVYVQATTVHGGGGSTAISPDQETAMLAWIEAAKKVKDDQGGGPPVAGCSDATLLNELVWRNEILPMLEGRVNYNDPNDQNIQTGCTRGPCHGQSRPGSFDLVGSPEETLEKFACFIDLNNPSQSQVLACPSEQTDCRVYSKYNGHPGGELFVDANDANYQRLLTFLFASVANKSPIDFAQFARTINPLFDDENACVALDNITCADTGACHGCNVAGCEPPNNSDFGILPEAGNDVDILKTNYASAHNFVSFGIPESSSLFLYPTDLIADDNNPFATGIPHGGGECFAEDSAQAVAVLAWAEGLRPNNQGFVTSFIITGGFASQDADDEKLFNEDTIRPQIFDESNAEQLAGEWEFFQSPVQDVDLGAFLDLVGGEVGQGRIAYASAYLINTTTDDLRVQLDVTTNNEIELYFGDNQASSPVNGGNVSATITIPPYSSDVELPRILMRVFEAVDDNGMVFSVRLVDADNNLPFNGADDDLIVLTGPNGGI